MPDAALGAPTDRASRLELARGVLRGLEGHPPHPTPAAGGDGAVLPVVEPLSGLLPAGGLRRGATVAVTGGPGSTSLLLALLAGASAAGAWLGVVGRPQLGLVAAAEAGIRLDRLALVPHPGADLLAVTSALLDGLDLVAVSGAAGAGVRAADRQRLAARARQRGAVLVALGPWPGADVELACAGPGWLGLGSGADGGGRLRARRIEVRARGRGIAPRGRSAWVLLPGPDGAVAPDTVGTVGSGVAGTIGSGGPGAAGSGLAGSGAAGTAESVPTGTGPVGVEQGEVDRRAGTVPLPDRAAG